MIKQVYHFEIRSLSFFRLCMLGFMMLGAHRLAVAQRQMEQLDRGVVALRVADDGVFLSWRLLATDDADIAFDVYRKSPSVSPKKLNDAPIAGGTYFIDRAPDLNADTTYCILPGKDAKHAPPQASDFNRGNSFHLPANAPIQNYLSIATKLPAGYHANDASVGDLNGDGRYEIVVHVAGPRARQFARGPNRSTDLPRLFSGWNVALADSVGTQRS